MVKAIVVNHDQGVARQHAAALLSAGYQVETCGGPGLEPCPVLGGLPCPLADRADVLIYDARLVGDSESVRQLVNEVRETYPDLPLVLTSVGASMTWIETEGSHRVTPLVGDPSPDDLRAAVEEALSDQGMAV